MERAGTMCTFVASGAYGDEGGVRMRVRTTGEESQMSDLTVMSIQEVAALLRYSVKTVYKKAARGEIPSVPVSRRKRLFMREAIAYWLANKQEGNL